MGIKPELDVSTVVYHPQEEEAARGGWYLSNRDEFVFQLAKSLLTSPKDHVLDVGCGSGGLLSRFRRDGIPAIGVDMDWKSLTWGRAQGRSNAISQTDACRLPFRDRSFDLCVSSEMLEHIEDHRAALSELLRVARQRVLFTVPAHMWLWTDSDRILLHCRRYSRKDVEQLIHSAGGKMIKLHGFGVLPMLGILGYRILSGGKESDLPLASRYSPPAWIDRLAGIAFQSELWLSRYGLTPCAHAWWAVVERA